MLRILLLILALLGFIGVATPVTYLIIVGESGLSALGGISGTAAFFLGYKFARRRKIFAVVFTLCLGALILGFSLENVWDRSKTAQNKQFSLYEYAGRSDRWIFRVWIIGFIGSLAFMVGIGAFSARYSMEVEAKEQERRKIKEEGRVKICEVFPPEAPQKCPLPKIRYWQDFFESRQPPSNSFPSDNPRASEPKS